MDIKVSDTVGGIVARHPSLARQFEEAGIDYCCGGGLPLEEACRKHGVDVTIFLQALREPASRSVGEELVDAAAMSLTELADHVEQTHHAYLKAELPRLRAMTAKVAAVHGHQDGRLMQVKEVLFALSMEMACHMAKEESVLFPLIRQLDAGMGALPLPCGSVDGMVRQMEHEHRLAGGALEQLRKLTDGHKPPVWACNTYRVMLEALACLERDMHQHVHKENNVLFPRAIEADSANQSSRDVARGRP
ncbi:MAG: iron-sulfur cluster repair di-iron protein [Planctomycetota bacterium]|nr:iron-sulfur cluster repair di-iron protein [Planctomycetota bacterium]